MKWFMNLKTGTKLILFSLLMIVAICGVSWLGLTTASRIQASMNNMYHNSLLGLFHIEEIRAVYLRQQVVGRDMVLDEYIEDKLAVYTDQLMGFEEALVTNLAAYENTAFAKENAVMTNELKQLLDEFSEHKTKVINLISTGDVPAAATLINTEGAIITAKFRELFDEIVEFERIKAEQLSADGEDLFQKSFTFLLLIGVIACLLTLGLGVFIARIISRPIAMVVEKIRQMAKGDFSGDIQVNTRDEIGKMAEELRKMSADLSKLINDILEAAGHIKNGSHEIATGNQDLSQRTQEQALSLEEITSTAEEINSSIQQTARNFEQANSIAQTTMNAVREGERAVSEAVNAIQQISAGSKQIAEIIQVVNDIAFQTNLLALNAAVEAARAGEQGRGFAVVAAEVRNLAGRTAESSKEIEKLIKESVHRVDNGNVLVQRAGEMLKEIVENTKRTSDVMDEISSAVKEQAGASGQIQTAIEQLNQVTQQNAAMVEEIAASSEAMNLEADTLSDMVSVFHIVNSSDRDGERKQILTKEKVPSSAGGNDRRIQTARSFSGDELEEF